MKWCFLLMIMLYTLPALCQQERSVSGIVADKSTQGRIAEVKVQNTRSGQTVYNNLKAEFNIKAEPGDVLVFNREGYFPDTIRLMNTADIAIYLKPKAIMLRPVTIRDSLATPQQRLAQIKAENSKAYGSLAYRDVLSAVPGIGAGISIDAIWNLLSRSGRNAAHLRELIEADHKQDVIDYRFNKNFVSRVTGLKDPELTRFMSRYRPSYYMVTMDSDYEFISYIKGNLKRFMRNPRGLYIQPLVPTTTTTAAK